MPPLVTPLAMTLEYILSGAASSWSRRFRLRRHPASSYVATPPPVTLSTTNLGYVLGGYLKSVMPLLAKSTTPPSATSSETTTRIHLRQIISSRSHYHQTRLLGYVFNRTPRGDHITISNLTRPQSTSHEGVEGLQTPFLSPVPATTPPSGASLRPSSAAKRSRERGRRR